MELLPAHFILAESNICMGGPKLKKAETFLVAAYWNLLKFTSDKDEKGGAGEETLVDSSEIELYRASLHKTFGRLFMSQIREGAWEKALDELSNGVFKDSLAYGPESIQLCSSYFYMGQLF